MTVVCYCACGLALLSALLVILQRHPMHALLFLILMLLSLALVFFTLGAPFAAAIQVVVYAGAIMVLFVFVVMMLNIGPGRPAARGPDVRQWGLPLLLAVALLALSVYALTVRWPQGAPAGYVGPKEVGLALFRPYLLAVELVSVILVAGLAAAFHLAPPPRWETPRAAVEEAKEVTGV